MKEKILKEIVRKIENMQTNDARIKTVYSAGWNDALETLKRELNLK